MDMFEIISDISEKKKGILGSEEDFKKYPKFMINRALMQHKDSIMTVAFSNRYPDMENRMHYDLLMSCIPKRKRRGKWAKKKSIDNLDIVMEYYNICEKRAVEYLNLLSDEDIEFIKSKMYTGGKNGGKKRR